MHYVLVVYMIPIIAVISTKVVGGGIFFGSPGTPTMCLLRYC